MGFLPMSKNTGIPDDVMKYKDLLSPTEFDGYQKMLREIEENQEYYLSADPEEMARSLISNCQIKLRDFYKIMKTISSNENL